MFQTSSIDTYVLKPNANLDMTQEDNMILQEENYIQKLKRRYITFGEIQSKALNVVILLLLLLNLALYTDMFTLIKDTFLIHAQKNIVHHNTI